MKYILFEIGIYSEKYWLPRENKLIAVNRGNYNTSTIITIILLNERHLIFVLGGLVDF